MTRYTKRPFGRLASAAVFAVAGMVLAATLAVAQQSVVPNAPRNLVGANTESGVELEWAAPPPGGIPVFRLLGR